MTLSSGSKEVDLGTRVESILSWTLGALPQRIVPLYLPKTEFISALISGVMFALLFAGIP